MRRIGIAVVVVAIVVGMLASYGLSQQYHSQQASVSNDFTYVTHASGNQELVLRGKELNLYLVEGRSERPLNIRAMDAKFGPDGSVYVLTPDLALKKTLPDGQSKELFPKGSVNGPLLINNSGDKLAYLKPSDFDGDIPLTNGVAVLDLQSYQEKVLKTVPKMTVHLYAWRGDDLIVELPPFNAEMTLSVLSLNGEMSPGLTLTGLKGGKKYPRPSFDSKYLSVETGSGTAIVTLGDLKLKKVVKGDNPEWTSKGLKVNRNGNNALITFKEVEK